MDAAQTTLELAGDVPRRSMQRLVTHSLRVLNLYAGLGGNRKNWENVSVVAVERDEQIASVYQRLHPHDQVIIGDAQYV